MNLSSTEVHKGGKTIQHKKTNFKVHVSGTYQLKEKDCILSVVLSTCALYRNGSNEVGARLILVE